MNREEKILLAIQKGYTCNTETGEVFGVTGKLLKSKRTGYNVICLYLDKKYYQLLAHQFVWYVVNKEVVDEIDHINGIKDDNRILNLRSVSHQQNNWNRVNAKGYIWDKRANKYKSQITLNSKVLYLGRYKTEQEARQAYLNAKETYHI